MIIAIDGPAASGKGTLAKRLALHYGLRHLDTGVIYRAVAKAVLDDFEKELRWFVKVMPTDYRRVLEHQAEIEERARQLAERQTATV